MSESSNLDHSVRCDEVESKHQRPCTISREDVPNVVSSFACFACFLMNGAGAASLGAALPQLCDHFHKSTAEMGLAFTARGIGYTVGTVTAAMILSQKHQYFSKEFLASLSLILAGIMALLVTVTDNFFLVLVWFGFQGMGFGGIETMVNVAMPAIWGRRVQPWMQAVFSCFGIGSMIGPAIVGAAGYHVAFPILAICSFLPATILGGYQLMKYNGLPHWFSVCCLTSLGYHKAHSRAALSRMELDEDVDIETMQQMREKEESMLVVTPLYLKIILAAFIFAYVGIEIGFAGWIPSYALAVGITDSKSKAAYLVSIFWTTITCGRMISTIAAIYISATALIRFQLSYAVISTLLGITVMPQSYTIATIVCACIGLSLSSIYPAMITIIGEYGFKIDAATTTVMITGGTLGASSVPILMDIGIQYGGPQTMPIIVFISVCLLVLIFVIFTNIKDTILQQSGSTNHIALVDMSGHNSRHGLNSSNHDDQGDGDDGDSNEAEEIAFHVNPIVSSPNDEV